MNIHSNVHVRVDNNDRRIKYDFPFITIPKVPEEVLKTEGEAREIIIWKARDFQHFPRDLAIVNEWQNHV